jgi:uncharacterized protein YcnI
MRRRDRRNQNNSKPSSGIRSPASIDATASVVVFIPEGFVYVSFLPKNSWEVRILLKGKR